MHLHQVFSSQLCIREQWRLAMLRPLVLGKSSVGKLYLPSVRRAIGSYLFLTHEKCSMLTVHPLICCEMTLLRRTDGHCTASLAGPAHKQSYVRKKTKCNMHGKVDQSLRGMYGPRTSTTLMDLVSMRTDEGVHRHHGRIGIGTLWHRCNGISTPRSTRKINDPLCDAPAFEAHS